MDRDTGYQVCYAMIVRIRRRLEKREQRRRTRQTPLDSSSWKLGQTQGYEEYETRIDLRRVLTEQEYYMINELVLKGKTVREVATEWNLSPAKIHRIKHKALRKWRDTNEKFQNH